MGLPAHATDAATPAPTETFAANATAVPSTGTAAVSIPTFPTAQSASVYYYIEP